MQCSANCCGPISGEARAPLLYCDPPGSKGAMPFWPINPGHMWVPGTPGDPAPRPARYTSYIDQSFTPVTASVEPALPSGPVLHPAHAPVGGKQLQAASDERITRSPLQQLQHCLARGGSGWHAGALGCTVTSRPARPPCPQAPLLVKPQSARGGVGFDLHPFVPCFVPKSKPGKGLRHLEHQWGLSRARDLSSVQTDLI